MTEKATKAKKDDKRSVISSEIAKSQRVRYLSSLRIIVMSEVGQNPDKKHLYLGRQLSLDGVCMNRRKYHGGKVHVRPINKSFKCGLRRSAEL